MRRPFALLLIALVTLTILAALARLPDWRLDLTEDKLYTLSPGTRHIIQHLKGPVTFEFYFSDRASRDMPLLRDYARRVRALLEEYRRLGDGRITLKVIDPQPFSEEEDQAVARGLRGAALAPGSPPVYFGLAAVRGDKTAVIPFFNRERENWLEYDVSELLVELDRDHRPRLAIYAEPDLLVRGGINPFNRQPQPPWVALESLSRFYDVTWLPRDFEQIPAGTELLLLIHPKGFPPKTLYAVDQYVVKGGRALIFVDPYAELDGPPAFVQPGRVKSSDLNPLFRAWGFEHTSKGFVGDDRYASRVTVGGGKPARHLGLLTLDKAAMADTPLLAHLDKLVLSSAGALRKLPDAKIAFTPLLHSSPESMLIPAAALDYLFDPNMLMEAFKPGGKPFVLAAQIDGRLKSAFQEAPEGVSGQPVKSGTTPAHLIVVGDTDLLANRLWARIETGPDGNRTVVPFADNGSFLINASDHLTGNPDLIGIRGRGRYERPFEVVERLRAKAQRQFQAKVEELQQKLQQTEAKLAQMKTDEGKNAPLDAARQQAIAQFQQERLKIRKELRRLQHQYNQEIESLGTRLKLINILGVPLALTVLVLLWGAWKRWRAKQARAAD
ncbi:hypothetical protein MIT9_P1593 [Methylomarinovum caldicuralii]|uniref:ABC-type uncharacterized transport system domain-containing protein n=1 Tax=Methylomarinovum caldicuralii TaxID=438856 RepID=A0AAU9C919_9GAMM|nr:Gldg family protein [Methylomarinovum caldicuralii]BCX82011.1 hypothetical protein MIT9_P1593 [Methylomarinovum caldicuralii]